MNASEVLEEVFVKCDNCAKNFKTEQGFKTIVIKHIRIYQKVINTSGLLFPKHQHKGVEATP